MCGALVREFTLENYRAFFADPVFRSIYLQTVALCLGATIVNLVAGYGIALFASRRPPRLRLFGRLTAADGG